MKKTLLFLLILSVAMLAVGCGGGEKKADSDKEAGASGAATYICYEMKAEGRGQKQDMKMDVYIADNMMAMKMAGDKMPGGSMRVVVDTNQKKAYSFMDAGKQYMVIDFTEVKDMPDMGMANLDPTKFVKATGQKQKIGNWECTEYAFDMSQMMDAMKPEKGEEKEGENDLSKAMANMFKDMKMSLWLTTDVPKELIAKFEKMAEAMKGLPGMKSPMPMDLKNGLPVKMTMSMGEAMNMEMMLKELKEMDRVPEGVFSTDTKGYTKMEQPTPIIDDADIE